MCGKSTGCYRKFAGSLREGSGTSREVFGTFAGSFGNFAGARRRAAHASAPPFRPIRARRRAGECRPTVRTASLGIFLVAPPPPPISRVAPIGPGPLNSRSCRARVTSERPNLRRLRRPSLVAHRPTHARRASGAHCAATRRNKRLRAGGVVPRAMARSRCRSGRGRRAPTPSFPRCAHF